MPLPAMSRLFCGVMHRAATVDGDGGGVRARALNGLGVPDGPGVPAGIGVRGGVGVAQDLAGATAGGAINTREAAACDRKRKVALLVM